MQETDRFCRVSLALPFGLATLFASASALARPGLEEVDKAYAYCGSSAVFVGIASKLYFGERSDRSVCADPAPKTVLEFADQGITCYPLIVEVDVQEYLFTEESRPRPKFRLYMSWASPDFRADTIEQMRYRLSDSPYIYSVRLMKERVSRGSWAIHAGLMSAITSSAREVSLPALRRLRQRLNLGVSHLRLRL